VTGGTSQRMGAVAPLAGHILPIDFSAI